MGNAALGALAHGKNETRVNVSDRPTAVTTCRLACGLTAAGRAPATHGSAGDKDIGLDRFGPVIDHRWTTPVPKSRGPRCARGVAGHLAAVPHRRLGRPRGNLVDAQRRPKRVPQGVHVERPSPRVPLRDSCGLQVAVQNAKKPARYVKQLVRWPAASYGDPVSQFSGQVCPDGDSVPLLPRRGGGASRFSDDAP